MNTNAIFEKTMQDLVDTCSSISYAPTAVLSSLAFGRTMAAYGTFESICELSANEVLSDKQAQLLRDLETRYDRIIHNAAWCFANYAVRAGDKGRDILADAYALFLEGNSTRKEEDVTVGFDPEILKAAQAAATQRNELRESMLIDNDVFGKVSKDIKQRGAQWLGGKIEIQPFETSDDPREQANALQSLYNALVSAAKLMARNSVSRGTLAQQREAASDVHVLQGMYNEVGKYLEDASVASEYGGGLARAGEIDPKGIALLA